MLFVFTIICQFRVFVILYKKNSMSMARARYTHCSQSITYADTPGSVVYAESDSSDSVNMMSQLSILGVRVGLIRPNI